MITVQSGGETEPEPSPNEVVSKITRYLADRAVLVRNPKPDRLTGLMVFLIGIQAIHEVTPLLIEVGKSLESEANLEMALDWDKSAAVVFNAMETRGIRWLACPSEKDGNVDAMLIVAVLGDQVCRELAPKLTALGAPTFIRPEAA